MHPDKKVGLALGILLIGITGAFFFRNDAPAPREDTLTLSDPESLDRKASQKPGAPYFPERQVDELANVPQSVPSDAVPSVPQVGPSGYQGIAAEPVNRGVGQRSVEHFADRVAPLPVPGRDLDSLGGTQPGSRKAVSSGGAKTSGSIQITGGAVASSAQPRANSGVPKSTFITHEVVAGDNLSRLAQKYLGSHSKYLTIYEANRDQLASPDDLSPGMKLKIPQNRGEATDSATRPSVEASTSSRTQAKGTVAGKSSFVQPDREAVIALGGARQTRRSLSQAPPPNLPRVEGLSPDGSPPVIASRPE